MIGRNEWCAPIHESALDADGVAYLVTALPLNSDRLRLLGGRYERAGGAKSSAGVGLQALPCLIPNTTLLKSVNL